MYIETLELKAFRNYKKVNLQNIGKNINIFYGNNAQGKTNLMEAVSILAGGKSFRAGKERDFILQGMDKAYLKCDFTSKLGKGKIETLLMADGKKSIKINGIPKSKISDLYGTMYLITFVPDDLKIIKESPSLRRRFFDFEILKIKPMYYFLLKNYEKVLKEKNSLLKKTSFGDEKKLIDIYNDQLVEYGEQIIQHRLSYMKLLNQYADPLHKLISGGESIFLQYKGYGDHEAVKEVLRKKLEHAKQREMELKSAIVGPHRDDIDIIIDGKNSKIFSSQGQQRTGILSLKLGAIEIIKNKIRENPILLLDDVFSELDAERKKKLLQVIQDIQVFITTCDLDSVSMISGADTFEINSCMITRKNVIKPF